MEDHHHAVLQLGGQVEGEARPRQSRLWWKNSPQHVVYEVVAVEGGGGEVALFYFLSFVILLPFEDNSGRQRGRGVGSPGGLHANSQDLTASDLPPFGGNEPGAGNTESRDPTSLPVVVRMEKSKWGRGLGNCMLWRKNSCLTA